MEIIRLRPETDTSMNVPQGRADMIETTASGEKTSIRSVPRPGASTQPAVPRGLTWLSSLRHTPASPVALRDERSNYKRLCNLYCRQPNGIWISSLSSPEWQRSDLEKAAPTPTATHPLGDEESVSEIGPDFKLTHVEIAGHS